MRVLVASGDVAMLGRAATRPDAVSAPP